MNQDLILQLAAFLRMQADGYIPVPDHMKKEARELFDKLGEAAVNDLQDEADKLRQ